MQIFHEIGLVWRTIVLILAPVITLPILYIDGSKEMACLYGVIIIATFWITEALPLSITSLLPIVLFPVLGVLPASEVAVNYIKDASMFSFSCLTFALCVEKWQFHKRIAYGTLLAIGSSPKWLTIGFMIPTWFLSMWVNNTSATAMMLPVVTAVLNQLGEMESTVDSINILLTSENDVFPKQHEETVLMQTLTNNKKRLKKTNKAEYNYSNKKFKHLSKALSLCVCYAATLGGIGSITGSSTNLIMQGQADEIFESYGLQSGVNFLNWFISCFPIAVISLIIAWLWLVFYFFGIKEVFKFGCGDKEETKAMRAVIKSHLMDLGPLSFAEKAIMGHFFVLLIFWLTMKLPGEIGWSYFFKPEYVNNSTIGIFITLLLFIFPSQQPQCFCRGTEKNVSVPALMDWKTIHENFPWGTWLLLGGGYTLAHICQESGLSLWIGLQLSVFASMEPWLMILTLSLTISFLTEITSNAATASILCPILSELAISMQMNPLYFLYPATLACSLAFMLPVATPPNAIVFATGHIKVKDMAKAGFVLNILCVVVVNIATNTWMNSFLQLNILPLEMSRNINKTVHIKTYLNSTS
ncbi:solute carrier family 13 member 2-like [Physella acuta]|uniref:solute carrier family 13 member 2-like n=1 Tax=Physella acuta TaxID=109671 RepID=UPI0027DC8EE6|nr:solute carrier family 13 member 2-like [Physella acuta]